MTTQECKCEDKNTDYHLRICCVETQQEQLEKVIRGCISKYNKEYSANYVLLPVERKRLVSAILSAMRIDKEALFKIISNLKIDKLASSIIAVDIASHAQEIIKFEEE